MKTILRAAAFGVLMAAFGGLLLWSAQAARGARGARAAAVPRRADGSPSNGITIHDTSGAKLGGRPYTISRVFAQGEIPSYPHPRLAGTAIEHWQADVKSRWADGSVRHALVSFDLPADAGSQAAVDFVDDPLPCYVGDQAACSAAALNRETMLAFKGSKWGAAIETTVNAITLGASVRTMLEQWNGEDSPLGVRYWLRGPVVTQVIAEDRSPDTPYDWGYKDKSLVLLSAAITSPTATSATLTDASDLATLPLPAKVQIDSEILSVCAVQGNLVSFGSTSCPASDGRAVNGSKSEAHPLGAFVRLPGLELPERWTERPVGTIQSNYERGVLAADTSVPVPGVELFRTLNPPFNVRIDDEEMTVCAVDASGSLKVGASGQPCPHISGRGVNGTKATAHKINRPIFANAWGSHWVQAPANRWKSLHPVFVLTFYANWPAPRIEYILENTWVGRVQDQFYQLTLKSGSALENVRLSEPLWHEASTRWRRTFWDGEAPPSSNVDYNLDYLIYSHAIPYFDTSFKLSKAGLTSELGSYQRTEPGRLYSVGPYLPKFAAPGGRGEIGLFPRWFVRYLYSMDPVLARSVPEIGEVSGYIPIHFRESEPGKDFDGSGADASGKVVSVFGRRGWCSRRWDVGTPADSVMPVGLNSVFSLQYARGRNISNWGPDLAHQASFAYIPYLITGDWYFLEELYFWAGYNAANPNPGDCPWCRHDEWGIINETIETRGLAWGLRNVAHAAWAAPTDSPEAGYFNRIVQNNIAYREGVMGVTNGQYYSNSPGTQWHWGRTFVGRSIANPLHFVAASLGIPAAAPYVDPKDACTMESVWMEGFNWVVWGHMEELGFTEIRSVRQDALKQLLSMVLDPSYAPKVLLGAAYLPTRRPANPCTDAPPFETWPEIIAAMAPAERDGVGNRWNQGAGDAEHGYPTIMLAAASYLPDVVDGSMDGQSAWRWLKDNIVNQQALQDNPKWALVPRPLPEGPVAAFKLPRPVVRPRVRPPSRPGAVRAGR